MAAATNGPSPGRLASVYSDVQTSRLHHTLPLPSVLCSPFSLVDGPPSSATGSPDEIAKLFPNLFGQPSAALVPVKEAAEVKPLKIGVVLSDFLQDRAKGSTMYVFKGGPAGLMKCKYVELSTDFVYPYRNQGGFDMICSGRDKIETPEQFKQAEDTANKLELDGLVVIGGDDSNTNACLIAEYFRSKNLKTRVIGCPKTIDGDLKCKEVPTSFGFDTACKVAEKKQTLKNVTDYITDAICKRSELGYNYGVILIPEGLIDFIPEVQKLIAELNEILAHDTVDEAGIWKNKLEPESKILFEFLPPAIQEQLMLERDPHGNVQVAKIETEKMLIDMVETELKKRKSEGKYKGNFIGQSHFFGYEGRCGLPTNFDASYCYALGYGAGALLQFGKTGLISSVGNLAAPVAEWTVGGTALTSLMDVERRHGKFKPVIKKAMVELDGDSAINKDAQILIMTTEILRNMLYQSVGMKTSEGRMFQVDVIVLDEVHYLSDISRGTVWEETVIYCPKEVQLICLSATVANPDELAGWISQIHGKTELVTSNKPLSRLLPASSGPNHHTSRHALPRPALLPPPTPHCLAPRAPPNPNPTASSPPALRATPLHLASARSPSRAAASVSDDDEDEEIDEEEGDDEVGILDADDEDYDDYEEGEEGDDEEVEDESGGEDEEETVTEEDEREDTAARRRESEEYKSRRVAKLVTEVREFGEDIIDYNELAGIYDFPIDKFQRLAIQAFLRGSSVVVSAPTSSGKTLIAEAAAVATVARGRRLFYTTPLKALSNQKFRDFRNTFGDHNVGLLTGDSAINKDAQILIMTTEILRNMLYQSVGMKTSEGRMFQVDVIVLDEVHYLSDISRGTVWEETVIYCPKEVQLICLSATVANPDELAGWISQVPLIRDTLSQLWENDMLPAIWFIFSRRGCDAAVEYLEDCRLLHDFEASEVELELRRFKMQYPDAVRESAVKGLLRGVAAHHAGCLPLWKSFIEELFQRGLVKVVFATETLAAGINMPARTAVISSLSKRIDAGRQLLTPNELFQMAGRAGRRGIDTVGHAVLVQTPYEGPEECCDIIFAGLEPLVSQFTASYGMVLNLLAGSKVTHNQKESDDIKVKRSGRTLEEARKLVEQSFGNYVGSNVMVAAKEELERIEQEIKHLSSEITDESIDRKCREELSEEDYSEISVLQKRLKVEDGSLGTGKETFDSGEQNYYPSYYVALSSDNSCINNESSRKVLSGTSRCGRMLQATEEEGFTVEENNQGYVYEPSSVVTGVISYLEEQRNSLIDLQERHGVKIPCEIDTQFAGMVEAWASGLTWREIMMDSAMDDGDLARLLRRTIDLLAQIPKLPDIDPVLQKNAQIACSVMDRVPISELAG
ncbi:hypothetical protein PR202_gb09766 [Eleusine coracana subsp. coracana]|uniref:Uncharacterized protein n=3 Tax=Magnoliopsida TaxID=3398 RepID=A0AAV5EHJ1_ELECO|nr:hypothetical protein PR202_gb09766 [Eleusine coracana subsp. coracana]